MSTYAIGDVQGCYDTLQALLERLAFDRRHDRLWLAGDLVNRGAKSLQVLRWAQAHDDCVVSVLGNHDLHLLARAAGVSTAKRSDTLDALLAAPDRDALLHWLRHRPLVHRAQRHLLVHAGLLPLWDVDTALSLAAEVEAALQGDGWPQLLHVWRHRRGAQWGTVWRPGIDEIERCALTLNACCLLRVCRAEDGQMVLGFKGPPRTAPAGLRPWFELRSDHDALAPTIVFGHWAALGRLLRPGLIGLDSGCVWGRALTAVCLEDGAVIEQRAID